MNPSPKRSRQSAPPNQHLDEEIALIRDLIDRLTLEAAQTTDLPELARVLNAVSQASTRLAALIKANRQLADDEDLAGALQTAINEVADELRLKALQEP